MTTKNAPALYPFPLDRLFCFGTLQIPEVLEAVIDRRLHGTCACLPGYTAFQVRRAGYPGLLRSPGGKTPGILYRDLAPMELDMLDRFEGGLYRRQPGVVVMCNGRRVQAWIYMIAAGRTKKLSGKPWRLDRFMQHEYGRFMRRFVMERRALYAPEEG